MARPPASCFPLDKLVRLLRSLLARGNTHCPNPGSASNSRDWPSTPVPAIAPQDRAGPLRAAPVRLRTARRSGTQAADIYWTRAVQYYGSKHLGQDTNLESLW